jgi:negative elongation factor C/D
VAQVGASLASYFDVYHRLLASRLQAAAKAKDEKQLRSIAGEIVASSVDHQHTYVHAQQLLTGGRGVDCFGGLGGL